MAPVALSVSNLSHGALDEYVSFRASSTLPAVAPAKRGGKDKREGGVLQHISGLFKWAARRGACTVVSVWRSEDGLTELNGGVPTTVKQLQQAMEIVIGEINVGPRGPVFLLPALS
jgi:hypothetical protein